MLKITFKVVKRLCFAFLVLYGLNLLLNSINFIIPINVPTVATVSILGVPGLLMLVAMHYII